MATLSYSSNSLVRYTTIDRSIPHGLRSAIAGSVLENGVCLCLTEFVIILSSNQYYVCTEYLISRRPQVTYLSMVGVRLLPPYVHRVRLDTPAGQSILVKERPAPRRSHLFSWWWPGLPGLASLIESIWANARSKNSGSDAIRFRASSDQTPIL